MGTIVASDRTTLAKLHPNSVEILEMEFYGNNISDIPLLWAVWAIAVAAGAMAHSITEIEGSKIPLRMLKEFPTMDGCRYIFLGKNMLLCCFVALLL